MKELPANKNFELLKDSNFWEELLQGPIAARNTNWRNEVDEVINELRTTFDLDTLALVNNNKFVDVLFQASSFAARTSEQEKITAFKNAILNTALHPKEYDIMGIVFLNLVNQFTVWHIRLLHLFDNPSRWFSDNGKQPPNIMMGSAMSIIREAYPSFGLDSSLADLIWNDLKSAGLQNSADLRTSVSGQSLMEGRLTHLGKQFLNFISNYTS